MVGKTVTRIGTEVVTRFDEPVREIRYLPFPYRLDEVKLGEGDVAARRKAIRRNNGKVVALRSYRFPPGALALAQIRVDPDDNENFYFSPVRDTGDPMRIEATMTYENLQQLMETRAIGAIDLASVAIYDSAQRRQSNDGERE